MSEWDFRRLEEGAPYMVKFDLLMPRAEFRPAGSVSGIPLVEHTCARPGPSWGIAYISAAPSADNDEYVVPFCGCRPGSLDYEEMTEGLPPP